MRVIWRPTPKEVLYSKRRQPCLRRFRSRQAVASLKSAATVQAVKGDPRPLTSSARWRIGLATWMPSEVLLRAPTPATRHYAARLFPVRLLQAAA